MKSMKIALALVAVLGFASTATAANSVWFELADGSAGGLGQVLDLEMDTTTETTKTWDVVMYAFVDGPEWIGYAADLFSDPKITFGDWVNVSPFTQTVNQPDSIGVGELVGADASNFFGGFTGEAALMTFTITKTKSLGDTNITLIDFVVGENEFSQNDFLNPSPEFDVAGQPANGSAGTAVGGVIRITNVPEPATAALLVLGGIALLRRRS